MDNFGKVLRNLREEKGLALREVSSALEIDQAVISKLERRQRSATLQQVQKLAAYYQVSVEELLTHWLSDKIANTLSGQEVAMKALDMAREKILRQAREDYDREAVFHQVYKVFCGSSFQKAWVYGPYASGKDIFTRSLNLLVETPNPESQHRIPALQQKLEKITRLDIQILSKQTSEPLPGLIDPKELILIWEKPDCPENPKPD